MILYSVYLCVKNKRFVFINCLKIYITKCFWGFISMNSGTEKQYMGVIPKFFRG